MGRAAAYWAAGLLHVAGWAVYYAVSRMLVGRIGYGGILYLVAAETLPSALSIPASSIAARRGYRGLLAIGFLEAAGLALFALLPWPSSIAAVLLASAAWAAAGPSLVSAILEAGYGGRRLGLILSSTAIGWSLGGLAGPLIYSQWGLAASMSVASASIAACYAMMLPLAPSSASRPGGARVGAAEALAYSLALSLLIVATEASFSMVMSRLSAELGPGGYAAVLAATGLASAAGKPLAGRLAEGGRARLVYRAAMAAYSAWMLAASMLDGLPLAALFTIPIYPFFEIGYYEHVSRLLGERRAAAAWSASYTIAGVAALLLRWSGLGYRGVLLASSALAASSLAATTVVEGWVARRSRGQRGCGSSRSSC